MTTGFSMQKLVGLILVVVVIVVVLFFLFMFGPFVDKIKEWHLFGDEDDLKLGKSSVDQFFNAYEYCKGIEGNDCLCDSGFTVNLTEEEIISIKEKSTLGGIRIESSEGYSKNVENVRHCLDFPGGLNEIFDEVKIYLKDDKLRWSLSARRMVDNYLLNEPFKLYRKVRDNKLFLCIPGQTSGFEECSETKLCEVPNQLCKEGETCVNKKDNYNGEGICCKESCVNAEKQNEANNLFEGGMNLFNAGNFNDARSAFLNVINNADYEETTVYDNAMFYYAKSLEGLGLNDEALRAYESLILRQPTLKGGSFRDYYLKADEETKKYFGCGDWKAPVYWIGPLRFDLVPQLEDKYDCISMRDSFLNECKFVGGFFSDKCVPCGDSVCDLKDRDMCEASACQLVGQSKCSYDVGKGKCVHTEARKRCSDIKNEQICETTICVINTGFDDCCSWNGEECVEK